MSLETFDRIRVRAPADAVHAFARDVEQWPAVLPHYRWVRTVARHADHVEVEMACWRPFGGPLRWPCWWRSRMWVDDAARRVRYEHVAGVTRGMRVEWRLAERDGVTEATIWHGWEGPAWGPLRWPAAHLVIGPVFVHGIAGRTLAAMRRHLEGPHG